MKFRSAVSAMLFVVALVVAPVAAAAAYEADEYEVTVSTTTPAPGQPFTVTVVGPVANPSVTLTVSSPDVPDSAIEIAGTKALTKPTQDGVARFTVTLYEPATYTIVATDADGTVLATLSVTVSADGTGGDGASGGGQAGTGDSGAAGTEGRGTSGGLAVTGAGGALLAVGAVVLVAGGALGLVLSRRARKNAAV